MPSGSATSTLLTDDEVYNLCISRGTLTQEEREVINNHIVATIEMLGRFPIRNTSVECPSSRADTMSEWTETAIAVWCARNVDSSTSYGDR